MQTPSPGGASLSTTYHPPARPSPDAGRTLTFCRDTASLTYLQDVRHLVSESLGYPPVIEVFRKPDVTAEFSFSPDGDPAPPPKPSAANARILVDWCMRATSQMLGSVVDGLAVEREVLRWLNERSEGADLTDAAHYLILAIGAQSCPGEQQDELAETYFQFGRRQVMSRSLDNHSIPSIQCYIWMTFYLLHAGRTEAAADAVGMAVRAAYTLRIHRTDLLCVLPEEECAIRERLWKTLRKLDLFISVLDGRPVSSYETRDIHATGTYSSVIDLSNIYERTVLDLYLRRKAHDSSFVRDLAERHRLWAIRLADGLTADGIAYTERIEGIQNLRLSYIKGAYYWSIMLLTRPFLLEYVSACVAQNSISPPPHHGERPVLDDSHADAVHVQACVDSAVHAIDLTKATLSQGEIPKRMPFLVNLVFTAALTLGVASFADLDRMFPLGKCMSVSQDLLGYFQDHDGLAKFYRAVIKDLQQAHDEYLERRSRRMMELREDMIRRVFGRISSQERDDDILAVTAAEAPEYLHSTQDDLTMENHTDVDQQPATLRGSSTDDAFFGFTSPVVFGQIPNGTAGLNELFVPESSVLDDGTLSFPTFAGV